MLMLAVLTTLEGEVLQPLDQHREVTRQQWKDELRGRRNSAADPNSRSCLKELRMMIGSVIYYSDSPLYRKVDASKHPRILEAKKGALQAPPLSRVDQRAICSFNIHGNNPRGLVNAVHMLDCWPVNLTDKFRGYVRVNCPGLELMFIPAGDTGSKQVNNKDLHKPAKDCQRPSCTR